MQTTFEADSGLSAGPGAGRVGADLTDDPAAFWRWVNTMTRRAQGWALVGIGALVLIIGYMGVAREALIAKQLPYLISGGIGGLALVGLGAMFIVSEDLRQDTRRMERLEDRMDRLEDMVSDLHSVLLAAAPAVDLREPRSHDGSAEGASRKSGRAGAGSNGSGVVVLPSGQRFHRADCSLVQDKANVSRITTREAEAQNLSPCLVCDPVLVDA